MITDKIKQLLPYIATAILTMVATWYLKDTTSPSQGSSATNTPMSISNVQVTPKTSASSPDLELTQRYTAVINDKKVEVPVKDVTMADPSVSTASTGATGYTTSVTQQIDITPLVSSLVPRWELGVGMGIDNDNDVYIPLSVQRNYQHDKAIQVELHLGSNEIKGVEVQHKWLF